MNNFWKIAIICYSQIYFGLAQARPLEKNFHSTSWDEEFNRWLDSDPKFQESIDNFSSIKRWSTKEIHPEGATNTIHCLKPITYQCQNGDNYLYPSFPSQIGKIYHHYKVAQYDHKKLTKKDAPCKVAMRNQKGTCQQSGLLYAFIASDIFNDSCGNVYRAFWYHSYLSHFETIADMFSRGRTQEITQGKPPIPESRNNYYEVETSHTYAVHKDEFFMLSEPLDNCDERKKSDLELLKDEKKKAMDSGKFKFDGLLWQNK